MKAFGLLCLFGSLVQVMNKMPKRGHQIKSGKSHSLTKISKIIKIFISEKLSYFLFGNNFYGIN